MLLIIFSIFLGWIPIFGWIIAPLLAGYFGGKYVSTAAKGFLVGAAAGILGVIISVIILSITISLIGSAFFGYTGVLMGSSFGFSLAVFLLFTTIIDIVFCGIGGALGAGRGVKHEKVIHHHYYQHNNTGGEVPTLSDRNIPTEHQHSYGMPQASNGNAPDATPVNQGIGDNEKPGVKETMDSGKSKGEAGDKTFIFWPKFCPKCGTCLDQKTTMVAKEKTKEMDDIRAMLLKDLLEDPEIQARIENKLEQLEPKT